MKESLTNNTYNSSDMDIDKINDYLQFGSFGDDTKLETFSYTGDGRFEIKLTINNVTIRDCKCNLYKAIEGTNDNIVSNDEKIYGATEFYDNGYHYEKPTISIWTYGHGSQG